MAQDDMTDEQYMKQVTKKWSTQDGIPREVLYRLRMERLIECRFEPGKNGFPTTNIMQWRKAK